MGAISILLTSVSYSAGLIFPGQRNMIGVRTPPS
ncbi:hypothetical protein PM8797T_21148 [Gimesia maris DSM 8797]|nr:hypothetical protein PM8797T_21148 [Gimesia maris DSM 8797]